MPDDWIQIVKADSPADHTDVRVEREYQVASKIASGHADVTDHAHQTASWDKDTKDMLPDFLKFPQEGLVVLNMSHLVRIFIVAFEFPIWW